MPPGPFFAAQDGDDGIFPLRGGGTDKADPLQQFVPDQDGLESASIPAAVKKLGEPGKEGVGYPVAQKRMKDTFPKQKRSGKTAAAADEKEIPAVAGTREDQAVPKGKHLLKGRKPVGEGKCRQCLGGICLYPAENLLIFPVRKRSHPQKHAEAAEMVVKKISEYPCERIRPALAGIPDPALKISPCVRDLPAEFRLQAQINIFAAGRFQ